MKFEDFLMERNEEQQKQKRRDLEDEVEKLQEDLDKEYRLNNVLQCAVNKPNSSRPRISSWLPLQVQMLLAEVTIVEEEIICLERKLEELKTCMYQERKQTREWRFIQQKLQKQKHHCRSGCRRKCRNLESTSGISSNHEDFRSQRKASFGSASEISNISETRSNERTSRKHTCNENPNKLSEELINCLINIFLKLHRPLDQFNCEASDTIPKLGLSCINPKGIGSKVLSCDPYGILTDIDGPTREIGPYKKFLQLTRSSLDLSLLPECFPAIGELRVLMHKLSTMDLSYLTYKQKLAFWINIYNACIMHAYLQHGLPFTVEKQLALMNKAALNVGGIVLNALAIEHFILRHPCDSRNVSTMEEKERLLWHAYGLGYPEPNVTFALCRGSWSSPALRIYTAEDVMNELSKAKAEYLEASIGVTSKKKILVPKLLHWHMEDFADNMESLLEWIYSQLPRLGSVNRLIMECLNGEMRTPITKKVEIQSYESEFRYLLPQ
ncbi:hypothetical protein ACHQM5_021300 [Ranunculus cassubicifolius]